MGPGIAIVIGIGLVVSGLAMVFADGQLPAAVQDLPGVLPWVFLIAGLITAVSGTMVTIQRSSPDRADQRRER